jgi:hypothetical protein
MSLRRATGLVAARVNSCKPVAAVLSGRVGWLAQADTPQRAQGWGTGSGGRSRGHGVGGGVGLGHTWGVRGFASDGGEPPVAEEPVAEGEEAQGEQGLACRASCGHGHRLTGWVVPAVEDELATVSEEVAHQPGFTPKMEREMARTGKPLRRGTKMPRYMKLTYEEVLGEEVPLHNPLQRLSTSDGEQGAQTATSAAGVRWTHTL